MTPPPSDPAPFWLPNDSNTSRASYGRIRTLLGDTIPHHEREVYVDLITNLLHRAASHYVIRNKEEAQALLNTALNHFNTERQEPVA